MSDRHHIFNLPRLTFFIPLSRVFISDNKKIHVLFDKLIMKNKKKKKFEWREEKNKVFMYIF
ncbi:MAG TPA: hypothetical protein DCG59_12690, partial [Leclercia adecarboxylata]|nr:hypothetical protein [Leclercia adecarboxylata]